MAQTVFMKLMNEELKKRVNFAKKFIGVVTELCEQAEDFIENSADIRYGLSEPFDLIDDEKYAITLTVNPDMTAEISIALKAIESNKHNPYITLTYVDNGWSAESEVDFNEAQKVELIEIITKGLTPIETNTGSDSPDKDNLVNTNPEYSGDDYDDSDEPDEEVEM